MIKAVRIRAAGQSQAFHWDVLDSDATDSADAGAYWGPETWTFTATAGSTKLTFQSLDKSGRTANGPVIAGVNVTIAERRQR